MNLEDAIKDHHLWREAFLHYVSTSEGRLNLVMLAKHMNVHSNRFERMFSMFGISPKPIDPDFVRKSHKCNLGKWIDSVGGIFKGNRDFAKLVKLHRRFHEIAAEIVEHIESNDRNIVLKLVSDDSEFHKLSSDIEIEILRIKRLIDSN